MVGRFVTGESLRCAVLPTIIILDRLDLDASRLLFKPATIQNPRYTPYQPWKIANECLFNQKIPLDVGDNADINTVGDCNMARSRDSSLSTGAQLRHTRSIEDRYMELS